MFMIVTSSFELIVHVTVTYLRFESNLIHFYAEKTITVSKEFIHVFTNNCI